MSNTLTKEEIDSRLIRLRNLERMYEEQHQTNKKLREENKELKAITVKQAKTIDDLIKANQNLTIRVEELSTMVFGKKQKKQTKSINNKKTKSNIRTKNSYKRAIPTDEEVTDIQHHTITNCKKCGEVLCKKRLKIYYVEDITIPKKTVTKHEVEVGYCKNCGKWQGAKELPSGKVIIGEIVRTHISYLSTILRLSYPQIQEDLINRFNFKLSLGELIKIQKKNALKHTKDYEQLKEKVRKETTIHFDETGDRIRNGDGFKSYSWLMQGKDSPETVFTMGRTRGKGIAEELLGDSMAVGVTDDYGVYRNLFKEHQLCFAHLHRKLRDLAESNVITDVCSLNSCEDAYLLESTIYTKVRELANRNDISEHQRKIWHTKLSKKLNELAVIKKDDPKKLRTYKETLAKDVDKYLTCVRLPNVPCDNNRAERTLRHIVLKRKTSFGHINAEGAEMMSILMSVFITIKNRIADTNQTFFDAYAEFRV